MRYLALTTVLSFLSSTAFAGINCPADTDNKFKNTVKVIREVDGEERHCSGTLVEGGCYVLTAGDCVTTDGKAAAKSDLKVKLGANAESNLAGVADVFVHPKYEEYKKFNIAVLQLKKCAGGGLKIDYSPYKTGEEITVGGYGATKLNSYENQPNRHMGKNKIYAFDEKEVCLPEAVIGKDGQSIEKGKGCYPVMQDSGSAALSNNKIRGVFISDRQEWLAGGKTRINPCFVNIRSKEVKSFLQATIKPEASQVPAKSKSKGRSKKATK